MGFLQTVLFSISGRYLGESDRRVVLFVGNCLLCYLITHWPALSEQRECSVQLSRVQESAAGAAGAESPNCR